MSGTNSVSPTLDRHVGAWLRIEGLAVALAAGYAYFRLGGEWIWLLPALLAPDVSMLGYLRGPRVGAIVYNLVHNWAFGLAVLGIGVWAGNAAVTLAGTVLLAHPGMDRALGYGLKLMTSFQDTHLGRIGRAGKGPGAAEPAEGTTTTTG